MEEAAGGPGPGSVTQLRVRCPGTEHRLAEEEEESGIRIQTQAREYRTICLTSNKVAHKRRSGQDLSLSSVSGWQRKKRNQESGWSETRPRPGDAGGNHLSDPLPPSSAKFAYKRSSGETSDIRWLGLNRSWLSNRKILNTTVLSR